MLAMLASVVLLLLLPALLAYASVAIAAFAQRDKSGPARIPMDERIGALAGLLLVAVCLWIGG